MQQEHLPTRVGTQDRKGRGFEPRPGWHTSEYARLTVQALTPEMAARTAGPYFYVVTSDGFTPHTAFRERLHLEQWLEDLGLTLCEALPHESGKWTSVEGRYRETSHFSYDEFFTLRGKRIRHLSNGDYTLAILGQDEDGVTNVHYLNCNLVDRPVFDPAASRALVG